MTVGDGVPVEVGGKVYMGGGTVLVRKKFPTVEYFFYGDTLSTYSSMCTTLLCYGSGIQRTAQYASTLTTHTRLP